MTFIPAIGAGGLVGLRLIETTEDSQKETLAATPEIAREIEYFRDNIGSVRSGEDLLRDRRLTSVALTAYGLESEIDNGAFVAQALDGGVEDENSFANRLNDRRWQDIAGAFGFKSVIAGQELPPLQIEVQLAISNKETEARTFGLDIDLNDLAAFRTSIESLDTAEKLVANDAALEVVMEAYGVADQFRNDTFVLNVLNSDLSDPTSFANTQADDDWIAIATAFQAAPADGSTQSALSAAVEGRISSQGLRTDVETFDITDEQLATFNERIGSIDSAEDLVADAELLEVALTIFGLENENRSDAFLIDILNADVTDENAFVNQISDTRWKEFNEAFNGVTESGGRSPAVFQYEVEERLIALGAPQEDLDYLRSNFNLIDENLDIVLDPTLQDIILSAFGLPKDTFESSFVLNMMISDPSSPTSFVSTFNDPRWDDFVSVFGSTTASDGNTGLQKFQDEVVRRFIDRSFEIAVGQLDEDLRVALNFRSQVNDIATSSTVETAGWFTLLGDQAMRSVVDATFGLPAEFAQIDIDQQEATLRERSLSLFGVDNPSAFTNPVNVDLSLQRYFLRQQLDNGAVSGGSGFTALTLLQNTVGSISALNQRV